MSNDISKPFSEHDLNIWIGAGKSLSQHVCDSIDGELSRLAARHYKSASHSERVADMVADFAIFLGVPVIAAEGMHQAARLHDIGKLSVPPENLDKSKGMLTDQDFTQIRTHAVVGADMIASMPGLTEPLRALAIDGAMGHQEFWNGEGYPQGLKRHEISTFGRILKIVDVYDAKTLRGGYQEKTQPLETIRLMQDPETPGMNGQFDPDILPWFVKFIERRERPAVQPAFETTPKPRP